MLNYDSAAGKEAGVSLALARLQDDSDHELFKRFVAAVSSLAFMAIMAGCGPLVPKREPKALPGERLGLVLVTAVRENAPPGTRVRVRVTGKVIATSPAFIEIIKPEKLDYAPQAMSVSYKRGLGTILTVSGFLADPIPERSETTLACTVFADGVEIEDAGDSIVVDEINQNTASVLCVFREDMAPPRDGE